MRKNRMASGRLQRLSWTLFWLMSSSPETGKRNRSRGVSVHRETLKIKANPNHEEGMEETLTLHRL